MTQLMQALGLEHNAFLSGGLVLMILGAALAWLRRLPRLGIGWIKRRLAISFEIWDKDQSYVLVRTWLKEQPAMQRARDLMAMTIWEPVTPWNRLPVAAPPGLGPTIPGTFKLSKIQLIPAPGYYWMRYQKHWLFISLTRKEATDRTVEVSERIRFQFLTGGRRVLEALLRELAEFAAVCQDTTTFPVLVSHGSAWREDSRQLKRPVASLALADGSFDAVLDDLRSFQAAAEWYRDRGVPYRRGYLFYGPPGTGKTTLAAVLAAELGMGVAVLALSDAELTDFTFRSLLASLPPTVVLLMEDVDRVLSTRETSYEGSNRAPAPRGVTLLGLLNALDGIGSSTGRILIMTSNHPEKLDPALLRPGRVDVKLELGPAHWLQARQMFCWFFKDHDNQDEVQDLATQFAFALAKDVTPATIQEHLLRYRASPFQAARSSLVSDWNHTGIGAGTLVGEPALSPDLGVMVAPRSGLPTCGGYDQGRRS